ncbi:hypothetical protein [Azonexus sp.]|uniref:hypothetical protein n=1 Tax=Azonexus sp. TaxID=1872668 RepID=UPI0035B2B1AE
MDESDAGDVTHEIVSAATATIRLANRQQFAPPFLAGDDEKGFPALIADLESYASTARIKRFVFAIPFDIGPDGVRHRSKKNPARLIDLIGSPRSQEEHS